MQRIILEIEGLDELNENHLGLGYDSSIKNELFTNNNYLNLSKILTSQENEIITPHYDTDNDTIPVDNKLLSSAIKKIYNYLKNNIDKFPCLHLLGEPTKEEPHTYYSSDILVYNIDANSIYFTVDNIKYEIKGDTYSYDFFDSKWPYSNKSNKCIEYRDYLFVKTIKPNGEEKIDWVKSEPIVEIAGKKIKVTTINKFEQYKDLLEQILYKLNFSIENNKQAFWYMI